MTKIQETNDDEVIKDGETVTVRINMMDSADARLRAEGTEQLLKSGTLTDEQRAAFARMPSSRVLHAPGSLAMSDADRASREEMYRRKDKALSDAWRNAPPLDPGQTVQTITPAASADRYSAKDARLEQMWRSA